METPMLDEISSRITWIWCEVLWKCARNLQASYSKSYFAGGINGVVLTEGDACRENRRFALQALREYGMGKPEIEAKLSCVALTGLDQTKY